MPPMDALARWPRHWPLAAVLAGDDAARWTILARPGRRALNLEEVFAAPLEERVATDEALPPFPGGWIGYLSYELGRGFEAAATDHGFGAGHAPARPKVSDWPLAVWVRCEEGLIFDHLRGVWWMLGAGGQEIASAVLDEGVNPAAHRWNAGSLVPIESRERYESAVSRAKEYISAGDVYQVNVAHTMRAAFDGDALAMFASRAGESRPRYGGYLAFDDGGNRRAIASLSPELFLAFDPSTRRLTTKPMKGTRPASADESELLNSAKDRAELAMIVDLLRNDIGRVSELGSVVVESQRTVERHGLPHSGVMQTTATISGRLRSGLTLMDALGATFPGGSITGVPKTRAMQIIDEFETRARGPYCGAFGYVSDSGAMQLNVAIRTGLIEGAVDTDNLHRVRQGRLTYGVGAGIVADSVEREEWEETLVKARVMGTAGTGTCLGRAQGMPRGVI